MKKHQAEVEKVLLGHEKEVYRKLKKTYDQALKDINRKSKELQKAIDKLVEEEPDNETLIRSKIYQLNYQKTLQAQISGYMDVLKSEHVKDINDYMKIMYEDSYISNFYNLNKLGVPVTAPINQDLMIKALTYDTNNIPLSKRVYDNVEKAKKDVLAEIQRGISTGMSSQDIARNIQNRMGVSYRKAKQLAQNEGHRVKTDARIDSMHEAKKKGADIVKVWDATLDGKTRPAHAELDQKHAEIDEPFKFSGGEVQAPKKFGMAALDINCRCALISVPRWDIEDTVTKRDNITGELIEAKNYAEWKGKYYNVVEKRNSYTSVPHTEAPKKDLVELPKKKLSDYKDLGNASSTEHYFNNSGTPEWISSLSDEQKEMIKLYTSDYYKNINNFNRHLGEWENYDEIIDAIEKYKDQFDSILPLTKQDGESMGAFFRRRREALKDPVRKAKQDYDKLKELENTNNNISGAIKKFELKDDIKLYRTVDSNAFGGMNLDDLVGTVYKDFSYMSTSPTTDTSFAAKDIMMELFVPKGTGRGAYIKDLSEFIGEQEFLLEKGSRFEIKEVVKQDDKTVIRMEWLGNDG